MSGLVSSTVPHELEFSDYVVWSRTRDIEGPHMRFSRNKVEGKNESDIQNKETIFLKEWDAQPVGRGREA
jgi:hypothetical protein